MSRVRTLLLLSLFGFAHALPGCGNGTSCIAEGALVETPDGARPIETLRVGDSILSVDPDTGRRVPTVLTAIRTARRACLRVTTARGRVLVATADHPCFSPRTHAYVPLGELVAQGEAALLDTGSMTPDAIVAVEEEDTLRTVYDLTVASKLHNFVADGVLVHNKSPPAPDPDPETAARTLAVLSVSGSQLIDPSFNQPVLGQPGGAAEAIASLYAGLGYVIERHDYISSLIGFDDDSDGQNDRFGILELLERLETLRTSIDATGARPRVVLVCTSWGGVWAHIAATLTQATIDVLITLDADCSGGWSGFFSPQIDTYYTQQGGNPWPWDIRFPCSSQLIGGAAFIDIEDTIPDNVVWNLEVRSTGPVFQDTDTNLNYNGSTLALTFQSTQDEHLDVIDPARESMQWVLATLPDLRIW